MKNTVWIIVMGLLVGALSVPRLHGAESDADFNSFLKRDRDAFKRFSNGKQRTETVAMRKAVGGGQVSPQRQRARELYDAYCRIGAILDNPDPKKGYNRRIADLRAKLFPTNRTWHDQAFWSDDDWATRWPFLQDLEARAAQHRADMDRLAAAWKAEGFESTFHLSLGECYGRKTPYIYLDKEDYTVFPSPIRTNMVDYVYYQLDQLWPVDEPDASPPSTGSTTTGVVHEKPPPLQPVPPATEPIDETVREENLDVLKPWDQMTPEERRRALMENRPEAWSGFSRDIFGTDTNGHALAEAVVACSNVTAVATNIAVANLPPPTPVPPVKPWDQMTDGERHEALKSNRCEAWDAVRDALLSGDPARTQEVLKALSAKPAIPEAARATAYWHGYSVGQMEAATNPEESSIGTVIAAYKVPELMALVRQGYDDARAGRPQKYGLPAPDGLQQLMPAAAPGTR